MRSNVSFKREHRMKNAWLFISMTLSFITFSNMAFGEDILGDYVLVTAQLGDGDFNPHTLDAISARITKRGDNYEITIDDILGIEPSTVPLYVEGEKVSFFLPPREFTRDGKTLMSNAYAYFGEIVLDLYIAGRVTYGKSLNTFKLKRVRSLSEKAAG